MHHLVPTFIIDNLQQNTLQGSFPCTSLFVDISGFTKVTETLMSHGQHGAEVMATIMRTIFSPPVQSVFERGGYVTNFAGDAFTAVFPFSDDWPENPSMRALAAAWQIQEHMAANARQQTRYGLFEFSVKIGLAKGEAIWGIFPGDDDQRAAYYFRGSAIVGSADAEQLAHAGDIIGNHAFYETIKMHIRARSTGDHWHITQISTTLPKPKRADYPPPNLDQVARFFPRTLLEQKISGEFRQVLSLFINLQGTPDHAQLNRFTQHLFELQDRYGGTLNRIDFADKGCHMLLFWGAPTSYENDITRVLDFILACRQLSEVPLRAGLTYRIAHAGSIGFELAEEYTCYGRGVNLAARYMTAAGWDEIWVDHDTARRAQRDFAFEPLGHRHFKGFAEPQPVYLLTGQREDILSPFADRPLVGRQTELSRLQRAIQPIFDGCFAGVVTVIGEAGIGKSRLVHELLDPIASAGKAAILLCQTDEIIRQSLNPFRYFLRHYFDQSSMRDEVDNKRRFVEILEDLLASVPDTTLRNELERTSSFLGSLVGLFWEDSLYEQLEPELRFENSLDALKTLFRAESGRQPVIIQIEDAHWLDTDTKGFLVRLTRNMVDFPLILLMISRDELAADLFDPDAPLEAIHLQTLGQESLGGMALAITHRQPSPSLLKLLQERTEGNPFYAEQLLLYLQENELLETVANYVGGPMPGNVYIPPDVRALLTARLDRLPSPVKEVVQNAAVLGREFEAPILFDMMAKDPVLRSKLETAVDESIWIALDEVRYLFQHALLRDAAYDMQIHSRLRHLHKLAGEAFEDQHKKDPDITPRYAEVAYHFDEAEEWAQACRYYGEAGEQAKENYSNSEAIGYFSRGLELVDDADYQMMYTYLCGRETIYQWQGQRDKQQNDLNDLGELLDRHPDDLKQADLALRQSAFALVTGNYDTAVLMAQNSLEYAQRTDQNETKAKAYHRWGRTLWQQGRAREAEEPIKKALKLIQDRGYRDIEALCHYDLFAVYFGRANYDQADLHLDLAEKAYETLGDQQGLTHCQNAHGIIQYVRADYSGALQHYEKALELCRRIGWRYVEPRYLSNIGNNYFDLGNYRLAKSYHEQSLAICREINNLEIEAISLDTLGLIAHYMDRLQEAVSYYETALVILERVDNKSATGYTLSHLGYVLADLDQYPAANSALNQSLKIRRELTADALNIDTLAGLAQLSLKQGQIKEAQSLVIKILAWIEENGTKGIELPVLVYLICYRVMQAAAKIDPNILSDAQAILEAGHALLKQNAQRIQDSDLRRQFMENVPYNRMLHMTWLKSQ